MASTNCLNELLPNAARTGAIVFEGDSITAGFGVQVSQRYSNLLATQPLSSWLVFNQAVSGAAVSPEATVGNTNTIQYAPRKAAAIASVNSPNYYKVLSIWAGINDLLNLTSVSAAALFGYLQTYITSMKPSFDKVVVWTTLPVNPAASVVASTPGVGTYEAKRITYNDLIRGGTSGADAVIDIARHPILGVQANTPNAAWFSDGIHLTPAAYELVRTYVKDTFVTL